MKTTEQVDDLRARFEARLSGLQGRQLLAVDYWDVHNFSSEPVRWDYGTWHHAVMGVGLCTDAGPATITWTDTCGRRSARPPLIGSARPPGNFAKLRRFSRSHFEKLTWRTSVTVQ
ncbi:hypothetical protein [Amycolatopsis sp. NPDC049868]|uniref:hypothetical protein n=1 Tax=Amycolatopsis sp. NPDC049868 TaxID=3363934 RepID=UPI0037BE131D